MLEVATCSDCGWRHFVIDARQFPNVPWPPAPEYKCYLCHPDCPTHGVPSPFYDDLKAKGVWFKPMAGKRG